LFFVRHRTGDRERAMSLVAVGARYPGVQPQPHDPGGGRSGSDADEIPSA
jgi:hypothetical protein